MKKLILIFFLSGFYLTMNAQTEPAPNDRLISVSYYGPYVIQLGIKVGMEIPLSHWERKPDSDKPKTRILSVRPQLAYFTQPGLHRNVLLETDLGYTMKKTNKWSYFRPSVGVGYLFSRENIEGSVNLGSGEINQERENFNYFVPTISLEVGRLPKKRIGYFFKVFFGRRIGSGQADKTYTGLEIGLLSRF